MAETLRQRRVRGYATSIYLDGTTTFTIIATDFHQEVKQYAATNFTLVQIEDALELGWITQQEYEDTMALRAV
jgi:chaperonin GroEL (HSP60 family)